MTYNVLIFTAITVATYGFTGRPLETYILNFMNTVIKGHLIAFTWPIQLPWAVLINNLDTLNFKEDIVNYVMDLGKITDWASIEDIPHCMNIMGTEYKYDPWEILAIFTILQLLYIGITSFPPEFLINKINRAPTDYEKFVEELLINKDLKNYPFPPEYYGKSEFTDNITSDTLTEKLILEMKNKIVNFSKGINNTVNNNITSVETAIQDNTNVSTEVKNIIQEDMDTLNLSKMEQIQNNIYDYTPWDLNILNTSNIENIGGVLYTNYFYLFIMAGFVLLVAMVGAIILTLYLQNNVKRQDVFKQTIRNYLKSIKLKN
jgi:hypothetical protein